MRVRPFIALALLLMTHAAQALEGARPPFVPPPVPINTGSLVQITFSLLLVLAAIVAIAWLFKRMNLSQQGAGSLLKVIGNVAIGQRERIVLLEVGETWLVVGVGPGQIRTLHTLDKGQGQELPPMQADVENRFGKLFTSVLQSRQPDRKRNAP